MLLVSLPGVIPIEVLTVGGVMLVVIVLIHGAGLDRNIARYKRRCDTLRKKGRHPQLALWTFAGAILLMLCLHLLEICIWGIVLNRAGLIGDLRNAIYFSANTYTTLGYGEMILPHSWQELGPIMAISGLFTFAWTTSELFNIVGYHHELVAELSARHKEKVESRRRAHHREGPADKSGEPSSPRQP